MHILPEKFVYMNVYAFFPCKVFSDDRFRQKGLLAYLLYLYPFASEKW